MTLIMPGKRGNPKESANLQAENTDTTSCGRLSMASLEETLQKFFAEADKNARDHFERLENQLDSIKMTLDLHSKDLDSQRKITTSLQTRMKRVEEATTEHNDTMEKLQQKLASLEDQCRRNNLRIINLKEEVEEDQALVYLSSQMVS